MRVLTAGGVCGVQRGGEWVEDGFVAFVLVCTVGALAFSAVGLLVASRAKTIEGVSGLLNLVMVPMWLGSGVFFSYERFPDALQPLLRQRRSMSANLIGGTAGDILITAVGGTPTWRTLHKCEVRRSAAQQLTGGVVTRITFDNILYNTGFTILNNRITINRAGRYLIVNGFGPASQDARNDGGLGWFAEAADNFPAEAGWTIDEIGFWGTYATAVGQEGNTEGFTIRVYTDDNGSPGTRIFEQDVFSFTEELFWVFLPDILDLGTYEYAVRLDPPFVASDTEQLWISVVAILARGGGADEPQWFWSKTDGINQGMPVKLYGFTVGSVALAISVGSGCSSWARGDAGSGLSGEATSGWVTFGGV